MACLNKEMGPDGDGWSDLVSLDTVDKGVIHRGIDSKDWLQWLFRKVREQHTHVLGGIQELLLLDPFRGLLLC